MLVVNLMVIVVTGAPMAAAPDPLFAAWALGFLTAGGGVLGGSIAVVMWARTEHGLECGASASWRPRDRANPLDHDTPGSVSTATARHAGVAVKGGRPVGGPPETAPSRG